MDKSIILDLVFDGRCYGEYIMPSKNEEYRKNDKIVEEIFEKLINDLPEEEKKKIEWDFFLALGGIESAVEELFFKEGFKLGLKLGAQNFLD